MDPYIEISHLNPLNFVDKNRELELNYHTRHFDHFKSHEQIRAFEQGKCKPQKWQTTDIIRLQVKTNHDPIRARILNADTGAEIDQLIMDHVGTIDTDTHFKECAFALDSFTPGKYRCEIYDELGIVWESEDFDVQVEHEGTLLFKYRHDFNEDIFWESEIEFMIRIDGALVYDKTETDRTVFIDQPGNASTVKGRSFRLFKLYLGNDGGTTNQLADKFPDIFNCSHVKIDDRGFSAVPGGGMEPARIERYAWAQWQMDVRETSNSRVKRLTTTGTDDEKTAMDYNINLRLHGPVDGEANDTTITINSVT